VSPLERFRASDDVADPLYGSIDDDGREASALADTVAHLTHACGGLLDYLLQLQRRCCTAVEPHRGRHHVSEVQRRVCESQA